MEKFYTITKKQDMEMTVAQTMSSILQNSALKRKKIFHICYDINEP